MTSVNVPRNALLPIYTSLLFFTILFFTIRPHLYYSDVLYDKPEKENFKIRKSSIRACLAITSAIQGNQGKNVTTT